ncbi:ROK family transcriptional regulator [Aeromonas hydrophila]|uniref:ROK family transcriptional regulator n=1 Tax=Aeromonas hydrophila TaxID=644 RepID=UPI0013C2BB90|nr:ROK family transcriptional regulator [Aeromonas hydrophila]MBC8671558.1 ROK family transcriptional regulator [Aeromonas hydrophila]MBC8690149.1 ROK family transcriptional regulator [Aeromonas hydrophila]
MSTGLNNQKVRHHNKQVLLALLYQLKEASKSTLARHCELSIPAVSKILDELVAEGAISHSDQNLSQRGINGGSYRIASGQGAILCLNISPTSLESILVDNLITPLDDYAGQKIAPQTPDELLRLIEACYYQHKRRHKGLAIRLAIAVHGQVNPASGVSQTMPQAPWHAPVELKYLLEERLGCEVMVDNDCIMLALAQKWQGAENVGDFCVINVDYGIGSAFIINGQIYRGALFGSGQIGHTIINPDGSACACGRYGCLETVASLSAIKKRARVFLKQQGADPAALAEGYIGTAQLLARYQQGDPMIRAMVDEGARAIGLSLYNFLNILNINRIWLYGRSCGFGEEWLQTIIHQTGANPFDCSDAVNATHIRFGQLSRAQQVMGIGYLYVESALAQPS